MDKEIEFYYQGDDEYSKVIYSLSILWNKISMSLDSVLSKANLNISKFNILMIIKHIGKDNGIQQNEISKRLLVTPSNITKMLDKLEKDSLITRNVQKDDKRIKLIKITKSASKLLDDIWPSYINEIKNLTSSLNKKDAVILEKILVNWFCKIK